MLGENIKYGHAVLEPEVSRVPFIFYSKNGDKNSINKIHALYYPTHYEISKSIAQLLGYTLFNKNDNNRTYFINGMQLNGSAGSILIDKMEREIKYDVHAPGRGK
jgi:hypothetical protein